MQTKPIVKRKCGLHPLAIVHVPSADRTTTYRRLPFLDRQFSSSSFQPAKSRVDYPTARTFSRLIWTLASNTASRIDLHPSGRLVYWLILGLSERTTDQLFHLTIRHRSFDICPFSFGLRATSLGRSRTEQGLSFNYPRKKLVSHSHNFFSLIFLDLLRRFVDIHFLSRDNPSPHGHLQATSNSQTFSFDAHLFSVSASL